MAIAGGAAVNGNNAMQHAQWLASFSDGNEIDACKISKWVENGVGPIVPSSKCLFTLWVISFCSFSLSSDRILVFGACKADPSVIECRRLKPEFQNAKSREGKVLSLARDFFVNWRFDLAELLSLVESDAIRWRNQRARGNIWSAVPSDACTDRQTDRRTENLPILQDFVPYRGLPPRKPHQLDYARMVRIHGSSSVSFPPPPPRLFP